MREISIKDTALIAFMQVGMIIAGVIWARFIEKGFLSEGQPEPQLLLTLAHHGSLALIIPLLWTAIVLFSRHSDSAGTKIVIFYVGLIVAAAIALIVCYTVMCGERVLEPGYHLQFLR
jgi:uncharacterized membrane protein